MDWDSFMDRNASHLPTRIPAFIGQDIKKVKQLALRGCYCFLRLLPLPAARYLSWLNHVLEEFGNVKELTHVDMDYKIRKEYPLDLVMMGDVVDIATSLKVFEISIPFTPTHYERLRRANIWQRGNVLDNDQSGRGELAALRSRSKWATYELPQVIAYKTITTREIIERYEREKKVYEEKRA
jgi:hypothetical protein